MNELREFIKNRDYVIKPIIIKNISKLNLEINEFLLILYFINVSNILDMENIKKELSINEDTILNTFNSLLNKKLIEIVMNKKKDTIEESISLDMLYDKLLLEMDEVKKVNSDIFCKFESEFGRSLSPIEHETINNWLEKNISEDTILKALKEAVLNGVSNLRYIDKIIYEWSKINENSGEKQYRELYDYNWLGGSNE